MRKNLFMVAAVAMVAFTACNKENIAVGDQIENQPAVTVEFTASFTDTKTALNDEGKKTLWVDGDKIDINGHEFVVKELIDGGVSAKFENVKDLPADFAAPFTAKYPYGATGVPATQTAKAGTFDPAAVLETATSDDHNLSFTNVTSLLKFQVPAACQTVTISSDDVLAGTEDKTVTVNGPFATDQTYYAAVLPGTKTNFVVRIDGYLSKSAASVTIDGSTIANMGTLPAPEVPEDAVIRINNLNGWDELSITIKSGSTTLVNAMAMTKEDDNIFAYRLDNKYVGTEVTYYITHSWYQTSTKTVILTADSKTEPIVLNTTYLEPGTWDWESATFGAWMWGTGVADTMVTGVKVKDDFFEFEIPATTGYKNVLFLRCDKSNSVASWDSKWNATGDLTLLHKCYCVNTWDNGGDTQWF